MKEKEKVREKNDREDFLERYYPTIGGGAVGLISIIYLYHKQLNLGTTFENILNSTITFSSITVGFIGVLLAVLFSIRNTDIIQKLFSIYSKDKLLFYFKSTIYNGLTLVLLSSIMFLNKSISAIPSIYVFGIEVKLINILFLTWIYLSIHLVLSTHRLINIMMYIIFSDPQDKKKELPGKNMEEEPKNMLKDKYKRENL